MLEPPPETIQPPPILDTRDEASFLVGHLPGAASIPAEQFKQRMHELPDKGAAIRLFDPDPARLAAAAHLLKARGYVVEEAKFPAAHLIESGPARARLWRPSPFLLETIERIHANAAGQSPAALCAHSPLSAHCAAGPGPAAQNAHGPDGHATARRALDLACGAGREAVTLAEEGFQVDAIDVLPDALDRAADLAVRCGVRIHAIQQDLKRRPSLPAGVYDLIAVFRFLHRPLLPAIGRSVAQGGFVVYEGFNWRDERGDLNDGELAAAFSDFEIMIVRDDVQRGGRSFSQLLARKRKS